MVTVFDLLSTTLLIAAAVLFISRLRHESPPRSPYIVVSMVAVVGNWLGNHGGGLAAIAFLMAGAFFTLHLASEPFRDNNAKKSDTPKERNLL